MEKKYIKNRESNVNILSYNDTIKPLHESVTNKNELIRHQTRTKTTLYLINSLHLPNSIKKPE